MSEPFASSSLAVTTSGQAEKETDECRSITRSKEIR